MNKKSEFCLICNKNRKTLYWHVDNDNGSMWCWCCSCQRGYSLREYTHKAGIDLAEFLSGDFDFEEAKSNEITKIDWPSNFVSLTDGRATKGLDYIKSRGLDLDGDMYYDFEHNGIVLPYYYESMFAGAQIRLIEPWEGKDGKLTKMLTVPGTRLGLLFFGYSQAPFFTKIKGVVVCEGAFNALALQQSLNKTYGGISKNPFRVVATSGCKVTDHQADKLLELKDAGYKIIMAYDSDEAGLEGLSKAVEKNIPTNYCLTGDSDKDWNDLLLEIGHSSLAKFFVSNIKSI
jgi:hypothetical protein